MISYDESYIQRIPSITTRFASIELISEHHHHTPVELSTLKIAQTYRIDRARKNPSERLIFPIVSEM